MNHTLVIIAVGIGAGIIVLATAAITIWCCCCRGQKARMKKVAREEAEYEKQRDQIASKHETRYVL